MNYDRYISINEKNSNSKKAICTEFGIFDNILKKSLI